MITPLYVSNRWASSFRSTCLPLADQLDVALVDDQHGFMSIWVSDFADDVIRGQQSAAIVWFQRRTDPTGQPTILRLLWLPEWWRNDVAISLCANDQPVNFLLRFCSQLLDRLKQLGLGFDLRH